MERALLALAILAALPCPASAPPPRAAAQRDAAVQETAVSPLHRLVRYDELRALRTFFERVDVSETGAGLRRSDAGGGDGMGVGAVLARLGGDWEAPFAFVRDAIRHVPYTGSVRGADGTADAGAGNALDQALLLAALLEARGSTTRLMRGPLQWRDAARLVVGSSAPPAPQPDDPWPRWLEAAADHWWVQARRDDGWVDLDPSFAGAAVGERIARDGAPYDSVPEELRARVEVRLYRGGSAIAQAELDSTALVGSAVVISFSSLSEAAVAMWEQQERALQRTAARFHGIARGLGLVPRGPGLLNVEGAGRTTAGSQPPPPPRRPADRRRSSDFQRLFLDPDAGPWMARLTVGGRVLEAGPLEAADLDSLHLGLVVRAPQVPAQVLDVPWQGGSRGRIAVVVAAGDVPGARLSQATSPIHRSLERLAAAELASRDAMRPPIDYWEAAEGLRDSAAESWEVFDRDAAEALGWAILYGSQEVDRGGSAARIVRQGLRLAAVSWAAPTPARDGSFAVVLEDPIVVGQLGGGVAARALRAAHGLLQSAVLSQVLSRLADLAPETAFDSTLRAIGTGRRLAPRNSPDSLPVEWPASVTADAARALQEGFALLLPAPSAPAEVGIGWWRVGVADGEMSGWVAAGGAPVQGWVGLGAAGNGATLDVVLGRIPALHHAAQWFAELAERGPSALSLVAAAACGSAAVATDAFRDLPAGWPLPEVRPFCTPG